jgi:hypothetical protein
MVASGKCIGLAFETSKYYICLLHNPIVDGDVFIYRKLATVSSSQFSTRG